MAHYYECKRKCSQWLDDMQRLRDDWTRVGPTNLPELHAVETRCAFESDAAHHVHSKGSGMRTQQLANGVISMFECASVRTKFTTWSGAYSIGFQEVAGVVASDRWLNDAVIHFACQDICGMHGRAFFLSSLAFHLHTHTHTHTVESPANIPKTQFIALPVHLSANQWGVIIVELSYPDQVSVQYDEPLCRASYRPVMQDMWCSNLQPFLRRWHIACCAPGSFPKVVEKWILNPRQTDGSSCGDCASVFDPEEYTRLPAPRCGRLVCGDHAPSYPVGNCVSISSCPPQAR